jgi:hypothetical protein
MREASRCSGYMSLSGTAPGRPLMINSVSRRGHRQILLATFSRPKTVFSQLMYPFQATRRRNLSLTVCRRAPVITGFLASRPRLWPVLGGDSSFWFDMGVIGHQAH